MSSGVSSGVSTGSGFLETVIISVAPGATTESFGLSCFKIVPSLTESFSSYFTTNLISCFSAKSSICSNVNPSVKSGYLYSISGI